MTALYNEIDLYCVKWLGNLSAAGHIATGKVDSRSIKVLKPEDLDGYTQAHFFAGIGIWSYAAKLIGWPDDVPLWTGSCPCQPFSRSGKRQGFADARHLWPDWFRLIREHNPPIIFGEQVSSPDGLAWLDLVSSDLEAQNYSFAASDLPAASIGAPHKRSRIYFVAYSLSKRCPRFDAYLHQWRSLQDSAEIARSRATSGPQKVAPKIIKLCNWATPTAMQQSTSSSSIQKFLARKVAAGIYPSLTDLGMQVVSWLDFGNNANGCSAEMEKPGRLSPDLARWLMGIPIEWSNCAPMEILSVVR